MRVTPPAQMRLPNSAQAPANRTGFSARRRVLEAPGQVLDEAELQLSELAANAVLHGAPGHPARRVRQQRRAARDPQGVSGRRPAPRPVGGDLRVLPVPPGSEAGVGRW